MDRSKKETHAARLQWPCATAVAVLLAAPIYVYADDGDRVTREDKTSTTPIHHNNPCYRLPAALPTQRGERGEESVDGTGSTRTSTRHTDKRDASCEQREFTRTEGFGIGSLSQARYEMLDEHLLVVRGKSCRVTQRDRQMGQPKQATGLGGLGTAHAYAITFETTDGVAKEPQPDIKCTDRGGKERRDDDD
jgi:hypothetical protein